jgi:hypothetical protein
MENLLWDYADGLLSENEAETVRLQLLENPTMQRQLEVILKEKNVLMDINLELPNRYFTDSVMAKWTMEQYQIHQNQTVNSGPQTDWILRAIGGLMAVFVLLPVLVAMITGGKGYTNLPKTVELTQKLTLPKVDYSAFFSHPFVYYAFIFGLVYLGLQMFDKYLQQRFVLSR